MKQIVFYLDSKGKSQIEDYIKILELKNDKDSRINNQKIFSYFHALQQGGVKIGYPYVKHINGKIWELRPLDNRILFFENEDAYIMLSIFRKTTNRTPKKEIEKAKRFMNDYLERNL